ncbi:Co2+/Mg2+ efflux protein ApaG [Flavipsychrobacter stenotrophus]|uniref:Co2+/Mg2+ efflux protein ApaG n=1 Tax=Flavipsychrobacter stenotrophus TaxID=2077091 RepID=A0A2S7STZ2_9BACT|nr:Co2+/Mg2+ efflux protein ApaG [Flavipsychrobacter stenotrophus]PQJ10380.1 Co2+/Mg2+ efflux protein ApaG [Flavipsychrobacter stenotrophus]
MVHLVTEGISIMVETFYQPTQSNPLNSEYLFAYRITIENQTMYPVKLLSRHWHIKDSNGTHREVQGEGVVGRQPIIEPGDSYQYTSAAGLRSDIGKMYGTYLIENLFNKKKFTVLIPEFQLLVPAKMN